MKSAKADAPKAQIVIQKSSRKHKKYQATDGRKTVHFGDSRHQDFTQHKDEQRKKNYLSRHGNEDHSVSNALSPAFLAGHVSWSEKRCSRKRSETKQEI